MLYWAIAAFITTYHFSATSLQRAVKYRCSIFYEYPFHIIPFKFVNLIITFHSSARVLNWGPGYAGDPVEKILYHVTDGSIQSLDRWEIDVEELEEEGDSSNSNKADETDTDIPVKDVSSS